MKLKDKSDDDTRIIATLIVCHCANYNTMLTTLFIFAPIFLLSQYMQLSYVVNFWKDPFS